MQGLFSARLCVAHNEKAAVTETDGILMLTYWERQT